MTTPAPWTVLIIDADADMRLYVRRCLQTERPLERGVHVLEAASGRAGLIVALSHPLDLIIADLAWPDLDPITFRRALRADPALARIPVLLVGPGDEPADREAVLPKPFNAAQLHTAIRLLLDLS